MFSRLPWEGQRLSNFVQHAIDKTRPSEYDMVRAMDRCGAAALADAEQLLMPTPSVTGLIMPEAPALPRDRAVSIQPLWSPADLDDARVVLEQLQHMIYAQGTSTGLNGQSSFSLPEAILRGCLLANVLVFRNKRLCTHLAAAFLPSKTCL
jgi:hypothetical protein